MVRGQRTLERAARRMTLDLLHQRAAPATICPSEVAKAVSAKTDQGATQIEWRILMPIIHLAIDALVSEGLVWLSWKGQSMSARSGPYRIGHPS